MPDVRVRGLIAASLVLASSASIQVRLVSPAAGATFPGVNGPIAYVAYDGNDREIWLANADGSGAHKFTDNTADDADPEWSPDGTKIAWVSNRDGNARIWVGNADGSGLANNISQTNQDVNDLAPQWSPDGSRVAWHREGGAGLTEVWVANSSGGGTQTNVSNDGSTYDYNPQWSPDGSKLVWEAKSLDHDDEIYVKNADGTGLATNVSNNNVDDESPQWSPNGLKIAWHHQNGSRQDIFVRNFDGSGSEINVSNDSSVSDHDPQWSPDGTKLAWSASSETLQEVYVKSSDGTGLATNVSNDSSVRDASPRWSPDGSRIIYESGHHLTPTMRTADAGGAASQPLNVTGGDPSWGVATLALAPPAPTAHPLDARAIVQWTDPSSFGNGTFLRWEVLDAGTNAVVATATSRTSHSVNLGGLTNGVAYSFTVRAATSHGEGALSAASNSVTPMAPDTTKPTATLTAPVAWAQLASKASVKWTASDSGGSGIKNFTLARKRAPYNGNFGSVTYATLGATTLATTASLAAGATDCFAIRATDNANNVGAFSAWRCTTRPLDDRALSRSAGWTQGSSSAYLNSTFTGTGSVNRTLAKAGAQVKRIGLVATKCKTCGTLVVKVGSTTIGKVNLYSSTAKYKQLISLPVISLRTGTVSVVTTSSGKPIYIDGLALSRQ